MFPEIRLNGYAFTYCKVFPFLFRPGVFVVLVNFHWCSRFLWGGMWTLLPNDGDSFTLMFHVFMGWNVYLGTKWWRFCSCLGRSAYQHCVVQMNIDLSQVASAEGGMVENMAFQFQKESFSCFQLNFMIYKKIQYHYSIIQLWIWVAIALKQV